METPLRLQRLPLPRLLPSPAGAAMKFRKKPVVIEAEQFYFDSSYVPDGVCHCDDPKRVIGVAARIGDLLHPHIHTLEGKHQVSDGDWIITGVAGEKYPCKPDIFEATYELVQP